MEDTIKNLIKATLKNLEIEESSFIVEHPENIKNGDYSTNVAMVAFKGRRKFEEAIEGNKDTINVKHGVEITNPKILAEKIKEEIDKNLPKEISKVKVAGAGFINFYLSRKFFSDSIKEILKLGEGWGRNDILSGKKIMVEYTDPNPFKPFHIGHLMTNAIGESVARIFEYSGAKVIRANYQGDVGPHVAKAFYGMHKRGMPEDISAPVSVLAIYIGECYSMGSDAYDNDENAKKEIDLFNQRIYDRSDEEVNQVYDWGRQVTLAAFEEIYKLLGTKFDDYFFESKMAPIGEKIVKENIGKVFEESEGAIVFHAEKYDPKLHTRVFITSKGIPLYETKEIGLTVTKFEKYNPDISIVVTAIEQGEYMKVVQKAISLIHPDYEKRMKHITHGMMKLSSGKMSSRKGNTVTGESLINDSIDNIKNIMIFRSNPNDSKPIYDFDSSLDEREKIIDKITKQVGIGAVKYSILKSSISSDIIYDFDKSISFEGDSGPYLQYTAVRANGIIKKAESEFIQVGFKNIPSEVSLLEHLLYQFPEIVLRAYEILEPHHIATYLTELASAFNVFYSGAVIVNKEDIYAPYRIALVEAFEQTMKNGLFLLGIEIPERM